MDKREYDRKYYHEHVDKDKKGRLAKDRLKRIKAEVRKIKSDRGCMQCGMIHPAALHFHHRDPKSKVFSIGNMTKNGYGMDRILAEIDKCDVLCANCHAIMHDEDRV